MSYNYGNQPPRGYYSNNPAGGQPQTGGQSTAHGSNMPYTMQPSNPQQNPSNMQQRLPQQINPQQYGQAQAPRGVPQQSVGQPMQQPRMQNIPNSMQRPQQMMTQQPPAQQQQFSQQPQQQYGQQPQQQHIQQTQQQYAQSQQFIPQQPRPTASVPQPGVTDSRSKGWADYFSQHSSNPAAQVPQQTGQSMAQMKVGPNALPQQSNQLGGVPQSNQFPMGAQNPTMASKPMVQNTMGTSNVVNQRLPQQISMNQNMTGQLTSPIPMNQSSLPQSNQTPYAPAPLSKQALVQQPAINQSAYMQRPSQQFSQTQPNPMAPLQSQPGYRPSGNAPINTQYLPEGPQDSSQYGNAPIQQVGANMPYQSMNPRSSQGAPTAYDPFNDNTGPSEYTETVPMDVNQYNATGYVVDDPSVSASGYNTNPEANMQMKVGYSGDNQYAPSNFNSNQSQKPIVQTNQSYQQGTSRFGPNPTQTYQYSANATGQLPAVQGGQAHWQQNRPSSVQSEMNSSVGSYTATNDRVNVSGVSSYDSNSNNPYGPQQTYSASSQGSYQQYPKVQTQAQQPPAKATAYQPAPVAKLAPNQSNAKMPYSAASLPESIAVPSISAISAIAGANTADKPSRRGNPSKDAADSRQGRGSAPATSNRGHSSFESSKNSGRPSYDEPANLSKYGPSSANSRLATGGRTSVKDAREDTRGARSTNSARARSRSRSVSKGRANTGTKRRASSRSRSPPSRSTTSSSLKKVDYNSASISQLVKDFNCPSIGRYSSLRVDLGHRYSFANAYRTATSLRMQDLLARFPDLYIPADFIRVDMDWNSLFYASLKGVLTNIAEGASFMIESNASALPYDSSFPIYGPLLEPPKYTLEYPSQPTNNAHVLSFPDIVSITNPSLLNIAVKAPERVTKQVKFNARVIISIGCGEKYDTMLTRKLRIVVGKRKGNIMLLGGSWCKELDQGDPYTDPSCLQRTARRCVLAQSLLDINDSNCTLTKLGEISYHRPQEEFKGKIYPEQDEISILYLCTVHTPSISDDIFSERWSLYNRRKQGLCVGPTIHLGDIDAETTQYESDLKTQNMTESSSSEPIPSVETSQDSNEPNHAMSEHEKGDENESKDIKSSNESENGGEKHDSAESKMSEVDEGDQKPAPDIIVEGSSESSNNMVIDASESSNAEDDTSSVSDYVKHIDGDKISHLIEESSALDLVLSIIDEMGTIEDSNKWMNRDKILREVKSNRGDTWTNIFKAEHGTLPDFLALHSDLFDVDGTKISVDSSIYPNIRRVSKDDLMSIRNRKKSNMSIEDILHPVPSQTTEMSPEVPNDDKVIVVSPPVKSASSDEKRAILSQQPSSPCVLFCPQPIPKDHITDIAKKNDAISLRVLPFNSILSYSLDDSNERIFEASIAAEMLKSALAVSYATIITDFLLADHSTLHAIADPRIVYAVKALRTADLRGKAAAKSPANGSSSNDKAATIDSKVEAVAYEPNDEHADKRLKTDDSMEAPSEPVSQVKDNVNPIENEDAAKVNSNAEADVDPMDSSKDEEGSEEYMNENDAKEWKKVFVSACRWYDISLDHYLKADQVQLILHSAARDINRSDMTGIIRTSCKDDKLRYEVYI